MESFQVWLHREFDGDQNGDLIVKFEVPTTTETQIHVSIITKWPYKVRRMQRIPDHRQFGRDYLPDGIPFRITTSICWKNLRECQPNLQYFVTSQCVEK